jgi:hypothetical protein
VHLSKFAHLIRSRITQGGQLTEGYWFHISGNENTLANVTTILENSPVRLVDDPTANCDSGLHGERILLSDLFCVAADDDEAIWLAADLVGLLNGIITLIFSHCPGDPPIKLSRAYNGARNVPISNPPIDEPGFFLDVTARQPALPRHGNDRSVATDLFSLSAADGGIYYLLRLFSFQMTWGNLYKILETVETLAEREQFDLQISTSDRAALTNSANNFSLTGLAARHGMQRASKPNRSRQATLVEGFATVRAASDLYLRSKLA